VNKAIAHFNMHNYLIVQDILALVTLILHSQLLLFQNYEPIVKLERSTLSYPQTIDSGTSVWLLYKGVSLAVKY